MEFVYELCYCRIDIRHYVELFHVCIGEQVEAGVPEDDGTDIQFTSGTGERSDEDFVDSALEVRHNNCSSTYKKHSVCFIVCSGSHSSGGCCVYLYRRKVRCTGCRGGWRVWV